MILVDSSIWIDHFRSPMAELAELVDQARVLGHPFVTGEIAMGSVRDRPGVVKLLSDLPQGPLASHDELLTTIERLTMHGRGVGYIDAHLIASALLEPGSLIWTRDKRFNALCDELSLSYR